MGGLTLNVISSSLRANVHVAKEFFFPTLRVSPLELDRPHTHVDFWPGNRIEIQIKTDERKSTPKISATRSPSFCATNST